MTPELQKLLEEAKAQVASMSEKQIEDMVAEQARSWVRAEMQADNQTTRLQRNTSTDSTGDKLRAKIVSCGGPNQNEGEHILTVETSALEVRKEGDLGWFVHFAGSRESLNFGSMEPDLRIGDDCEIRIYRMTPR